MANLVIFERGGETYSAIERELSEHHVVDMAVTLGGAFDVLQKMLASEMAVDYVIVGGGTLSKDRNKDYPVFTYQPPQSDATFLSLLSRRERRRVVRSEQPVEFYPNNYLPPHQDARIITDIIERCGIDARVIGVSKKDELKGWDMPLDHIVTTDMLHALPYWIAADQHLRLG